MLRRIAENSPYRLLGLWDHGFRNFTNRVRPLRSPADCRGLNMHTQMSAWHGEALGALGLVPIAADVKEFTEQIGGDGFDAQDNPLAKTFNFGVNKYHRDITLSGHFFGMSAMICLASHYASWPAEVRAAVGTCATLAIAYQHVLAAGEDAAILQKMDSCENEILDLSAAEHTAFVATVAPASGKYGATLDARLFNMLAGEAT